MSAHSKDVETIYKQLKALPAGSQIGNELMTQVNVLAMQIRDAFDNDERKRVFILRLISIVIAVLLCALSGVDAVHAMADSYPNLFEGWLGKLYQTQGQTTTPADPVVKAAGVIVTGVAAASGSSYWHDALDKVRNIKNLAEQVKKQV